MKISQLISDSAHLPISFSEGETLNVYYTPSKMTPASLADMGTVEGLSGQEQVDAIVRLTANLLTKWDLTDDNNKVIPVTEEGLRHVPLLILNRVLVEIAGDMQVGKANGAESSKN